ncbi:MAG: PHB depolymerase family esterase [Myxococcota bacterium]
MFVVGWLVACSSSPEPATPTAATGTPEVPEPTATTATTGGPTADTQDPGPVCRAAGDYDETIEVDGRPFRYRLHVPPTGAEPRAAILQLHGGGSDGAAIETVTGLSALGDQEGFATLTPEGFAVGKGGPQVWNAGSCCGPPALLPDHVASMIAMIDDAQTKGACLDADRIFATGHSNGGMMSYRLACEASDRIAAVAISAGTLATVEESVDPPLVAFECTPSRPVPLLHVHGLEDLCVPYDGAVASNGQDRLGVEAAVEVFRTAASCPDEPTDETEGVVRTRTWTCPQDIEIALVTVEELGHPWAGSPIYGNPEQCGGTTTDAISTTTEAWAFFERHGR